MKWVQSLTQWRKERNITTPQGSFVPSIQEELQEYSDAVTQRDRIDAIGDIIVFAANEMALEGYNLDLVMKQICKEILSRKQDPEQAALWAKNGPSGKWQKDRSQDPTTLYKADFSFCKLTKEQ